MRSIFLGVSILFSLVAMAQNFQVMVGTYTRSGSYGIYQLSFNELNGELAVLDSVQSSNPSYLAIHPNGKIMVAVNENDPGRLTSYGLSQNGKWTEISSQDTRGAHPCYVSINKAGNVVVVANYSGGSVTVYRMDSSGRLSEALQHIQRSGSSVNSGRQKAPHAHSAIFSPDEKYVVVADLGTDEVVAYPFRASRSRPLQEKRAKIYAAKPGSGPRHTAFHPNARVLYVMEELSGTVTALQFRRGAMRPLQTILADDISKSPGSADIHVHSSGSFVYGSNRIEANNISTFKVLNGGQLELVGHQTTGGQTPRNFTLSPSGKYLVVANQNSNNIVVFKIGANGMPVPTGFELQIASPVCLKFYKPN